ncbi:Protein of unknown function [Gryllus bimaculatus]|nr:Protein of unknown function [Gryllus bimaculatus]
MLLTLWTLSFSSVDCC